MLLVKQDISVLATHPWDVWIEARADIPEDLAEKGITELTQFEVYRMTDHSEFKIGQFHLQGMPGCCGVVVSCFAYLSPDNRHTGLSKPFRAIKETVAKKLGYTVMIATSEITNIPAFISMQHSGYEIVKTFTNKRTQHVLAFGIKQI